MINNNPSIPEYYSKLIPDNSVFDLVSQKLYSKDIPENFPYYNYIKKNPYNSTEATSTLYRAYYKVVTTVPIVRVSDCIDNTFNRDSKEIIECSAIISKSELFEEHVYYIAVWIGAPIKFLNNVNYVLGVGF